MCWKKRRSKNKVFQNKKDRPQKVICQIGPGDGMPGGMLTVIRLYMTSQYMEGVKQEHIVTVSSKNKINTFIKGLIKYLWMCIRDEVLIAHIHMSERGSCYRAMILVVMSHFFGVPTIIHSHGSEFETFYQTLTGIRKKIFALSMDKVDAVIILTPGWADIWRSIVSEDKIKIIPNCVDIHQKGRKRYFIENTLNILFLGYIGERKGTYDLIKAVKLLKDRGLDICLRIGGNGEKDKCEDLISILGLSEEVIIYGWVDDHEKETLFEISDVLALPSYHESFGIVILEAFAHQIPVICGDKGFSKEIVTDGEDGYVVQSGNIEQIADRLEGLYSDTDISKMGDAGYKKVYETYSEEKIMGRLRELYKEIG